jgi:hypothetical protein
MFGLVLVHVPMLLFPLLQLPQPTRDCGLEVLTPQTVEDRAMTEYRASIDAYVKLHRRLARALPPMPFDDEDLFRGEELRAALLAARPHARQGNVFTPAVVLALRARIDAALLAHPGAPTDPMALGYEPLPGEPPPAINGTFPQVIAAVGWLPLQRALPPLPRELDYALWGRDLVLVDVLANLVVDILPEALPEGARPGDVYR